MTFTVYSDYHCEIAFTNMSYHLMQGPGRPTRNSQQAGIAERLLSFGRHRSLPSDTTEQATPAGIPTVVQTPASPVLSADSEERFPHTPNPFHLEEDQDFSTTIHLPVQGGTGN